MSQVMVPHPQPTPVAHGRHVRLCPEHRRVLDDELICPHGSGHVCDRWITFDTAKGIALTLTSESGDHDKQLNQPLRIADEKEKSMRGVPGSGPYGDPSKAKSKPKASVEQKPKTAQVSVPTVRLSAVEAERDALLLVLRLVLR